MNRSRVTGDLTASGLLYADIANDRVGIGSTIPGNKLSLPDSAKIGLGNAEDLTVVHDGNNSTISNSTGQLSLNNSGGNITMRATDSNGDFILRVGGSTASENAIVAVHHGEVILSCNGATKLTTLTDGVKITGELYLDDNSDIKIGTSQDINIWHNGTSSGFDNKTGHLYIRGNYAGDVGGNIYIQALSGEESIVCIHDAAVELYHNGGRKFHTKTEGVAVEGSVNLEGSQNTQPSHGGINRHSNGWVYFSGKSDGSGVSLNNGDGTATVRAVSPGGSSGYISMESGNGTERLRIDASGDLRIGNTTQTFLDAARNLVVGGGSGSEGITIYSGNSDGGFIAFADGTSDPAYRMGQIIYDHSGNEMVFRTNGNNSRLTIKSDGGFSLTSENTTGWLLKAGQDASSYSAIDGHFPTTNRSLYLNQETTHRSFVVWNKNGSDGYGFGLDTSGNFKVVKGINERLRIGSGGAVGINTNFTTGVGAKLRVGTQFLAAGNSVADGGIVIVPENGSTITTGQVMPMICAAGQGANPGIARAGIAAVSISGRSGMDLLFLTRFQADGTDMDVTTDEQVRITSDGKVGINSTAPTHHLEVRGNARIHNADPSLYLQSTANASNTCLIRMGDSGSFQRASISYDLNSGFMMWKLGGAGNNVEHMRYDGANNRLHIGKRDGNSNSTHWSTARVSIVGPDPIATSVSKAASYLAIGNNESELNGVYPITFGYTNNSNSHQPAYIAYKTTNAGSAECGVLSFGTRNVITDTAPTERLRIATNGSVGVNVSNPQVYDPAARALVVGEVDAYGHTGMTIASNGTDKQGAIYFADGTGSSSYRGRIEYNHSDDSLRFGTAGGGNKINIDTNGSVTISSSQNEKMILSGTTEPYIRWQESTTDKAYIQWRTDGYIQLVNMEDQSYLRVKDTIDFSQDGTDFHRVHHDDYFGHWGDDYLGLWVGTQNASTTVRDDEKDKWYKIAIHDVSWSGGANTVDIVRANVHQDAAVHGNWYGSLDARIVHRTSRCGHGASYLRWVHHFSSSPPSGGFIGKTSNYLACGESSRLYVWLRGQASYAIRINGRPAYVTTSSGGSTQGGPGSSQVQATELWDPITSIQASSVMAMGNDTYLYAPGMRYGGQGATDYGTKCDAVAGGISVTGDVSATGNKPFRIPHPLVGLSTTKDLIHTAVEGPQADLIYRGKVDLVSGTVTVNLDTKTGMTEGTFVALNRDVQCFTTNETGWTNVKGSVSGNILTITAQDSNCTDTISWMVVGERQDDKIKESLITDSDGHLLLEVDQEPITETDFLDTSVENQTDEQVSIMNSMMN